MHAVTNLVRIWISHAGVIIVVSTALYSYMLALYLAFPPSPQKKGKNLVHTTLHTHAQS